MSDSVGFPSGFDQVLEYGQDSRAYFGCDVLGGLIEGIREAQRAETLRGSSSRSLGLSVLGCSMWMDDQALLDVLSDCAASCIVVTKQPLDGRSRARVEALQRASASCKGLPQSAFPELTELSAAPGHIPLTVGPYTSDWRQEISAVRELGFRKVDRRLVPIVHAKMVSLGHLGWTDEHPSGHLVDEIYFLPDRLWIGSANFTAASRKSLEMGMWTSDRELLTTARGFLLKLIGDSEPLGTQYDDMTPELRAVEYDDAAIFEYLADIGYQEGGVEEV